METKLFTLHSGGAQGSEANFGKMAEEFGVNEINYSFDGHITERKKGIKILTEDELKKGDFCLDYISKIMHRKYKETFIFKRILQTVFYQIINSEEVFVIGNITEHQTVKGGTGWGAEFAKIMNRDLYVFDQDRDFWSSWSGRYWQKIDPPQISKKDFAGVGTRLIKDNGINEIKSLFKRSF